jgi:hypothetical protein
VLVGDRGLLLASPILLAAAAGLLMLARRSRPEALLCGTVAGLYLLLEFGYFLPYGGVSPGPRFLLPAIPFLALGLAPMYQKRHRLTVLLAVPSIVASTAVAVTWSSGVQRYQQTIWGQLVRSALRADSHLRRELTDNLLSVFGVGRMEAALAVSASSGLALLVALRSRRSEPTTAPAGSIATLELGVSTDSTVTLELAAFEPVDGGAT